MRTNPFFELYVGDRISSREFVTIFSPALVPHIEALFLPGNIVVKGVQGCGKSMLLSLLRPEVRVEYASVGEPFPVPKRLRKFLCSSINLAHSNVIDFGYRNEIDADVQKVEFLFADFLNYIVAERLLKCIKTYSDAGQDLRDEVGLRICPEQLDHFAEKVSLLPVWEGWVGKCDTFEELTERLIQRTLLYRRYLHGKDKVLDPILFDTSTQIGEPIAQISRFLRAEGFIDQDTNVLVDIDQYEELGTISSRDGQGGQVDYRSVINKALSARSPDVSYRIGTRGHSWGRNIKIHGTDGNLEAMRDYKFIDLDALLMKDEIDAARAKNTFSSFAEDVFQRRLRFAQFNFPSDNTFSALRSVYGNDLSPEEKVNEFFGLKSPERFIRVEKEWRTSTKKRLTSLAKANLFNAKLGEAWIRQKGDVVELDMRDELLPWNQKSKRWWRKERAQAICMQIASQGNQRMIWGGAREIIELSGGSILAFLGINQFIWSSWIQRSVASTSSSTQLPEIEVGLQSIAILKASNAWLEMILEQTGNSSERMRFLRTVSAVLKKKMMEDRALSYPGANGFSLTDEALSEEPMISDFLGDLSDYGNMMMLQHTTKLKDRRTRKKFYFHPIFAPSFGLPHIRTKEPYYTKISELAEWMNRAGLDVKFAYKRQTQIGFFD